MNTRPTEQAMTAKQHAFARGVASGLSLADAYREAYAADKMKPATIQREAVRLMANPKVTTVITRLRAAQEAATVHMAISDRDLVLRKLRDLLQHPEGTPAEQVALKAAHLRGQSIGLYQRTVQIDDRRDRTPEEIRREIEERIAALDPVTDESVH